MKKTEEKLKKVVSQKEEVKSFPKEEDEKKIKKEEVKEESSKKEKVVEREIEGIADEKAILDNWQNFEPKKRREIVISERKQQFSLEGMTGSFPIKEKESDEEDFNYTRNNRGYEEKKEDYSSSNSSGSYSVSSLRSEIDITKPRREFFGNEVQIQNNSGEFFGAKEQQRDYSVSLQSKFDERERKSIFEMENDKMRDVNVRDYQQK